MLGNLIWSLFLAIICAAVLNPAAGVGCFIGAMAVAEIERRR